MKNKRPPPQGRQKIEIKKLEKKSNKQVTFSKRRSGIFKKAGELSLLCGCDVAVIVFSPNDKLFCFGHPSVDAMIRRYLNGTLSSSTTTSNTTTTSNYSETSAAAAATGEFNMRAYVENMKELEAEKKRVAEARHESALKFEGGGSAWWEEAVDGMEVEELEYYVGALYELRRKVFAKVEDSMKGKSGSPLPITASFRNGQAWNS